MVDPTPPPSHLPPLVRFLAEHFRSMPFKPPQPLTPEATLEMAPAPPGRGGASISRAILTATDVYASTAAALLQNKEGVVIDSTGGAYHYLGPCHPSVSVHPGAHIPATAHVSMDGSSLSGNAGAPPPSTPATGVSSAHPAGEASLPGTEGDRGAGICMFEDVERVDSVCGPPPAAMGNGGALFEPATADSGDGAYIHPGSQLSATVGSDGLTPLPPIPIVDTRHDAHTQQRQDCQGPRDQLDGELHSANRESGHRGAAAMAAPPPGASLSATSSAESRRSNAQSSGALTATTSTTSGGADSSSRSAAEDPVPSMGPPPGHYLSQLEHLIARAGGPKRKPDIPPAMPLLPHAPHGTEHYFLWSIDMGIPLVKTRDMAGRFVEAFRLTPQQCVEFGSAPTAEVYVFAMASAARVCPARSKFARGGMFFMVVVEGPGLRDGGLSGPAPVPGCGCRMTWMTDYDVGSDSAVLNAAVRMAAQSQLCDDCSAAAQIARWLQDAYGGLPVPFGDHNAFVLAKRLSDDLYRRAGVEVQPNYEAVSKKSCVVQ